MSKQLRKNLVPALRFPEFQDIEEWDAEELGNHLDYLQPTKHLVSSTAYKDIYKTPVLTAGKTFILGYTDETEGIFQKNLPVIIFDDFTTASKFVDFPFKAKSSAMKILLAKNESNIKFFFESMQVITYEVGVHERHWISTFSKLRVPVPKSEEQQKIADCLTSIDELLTAQNQKLEALKAHKKGLMQQLFPAEDETVPKLRFPEFRGEWHKEKVEDLAKRGSGHTPNKKFPEYYNGGINWVSLADSKKLDNGLILGTSVEISQKGLNNSSAVLHSAGSVIVSRDAGVGKSAVLNVAMAVSQHFIAWQCKKKKLSNWYLYYFLQLMKPVFEDIAVGNAIKTIGLPYFKELLIPAPSIEEQEKVADYLSSIDELITAQSKKIEALKVHKKGLMQQLFPAVDKVEV